MSIGHRQLDNEELIQASIEQLYEALGEENTPELFAQSYKTDFDHDIATGGGVSVDRKTIYIDHSLYTECMDSTFYKTGLTPQQIIERWLDHEHIEKCMVDGDNPVDNYYPAHTRALKFEHQRVLAILGYKNPTAKIRQYEETIWPALLRCYHRPIKKVPKDLWCAPVLDDPTERDEEILETYRKLGVVDANKRAKYEVHYQPGPNNCEDCRYWNPDYLSQDHGKMAACKITNGIVRHDMRCDWWAARRG